MYLISRTARSCKIGEELEFTMELQRMATQLARLSKSELIAEVLSLRSGRAMSACKTAADKGLAICRASKNPLEDLKSNHIKQKHTKSFDISKYGQDHVAIKIAYFGKNYSGFSCQNNEEGVETVEGILLEAAEKTKLIPPGSSIADIHWSRCGRTDKGVSSFGNVVTFLCRKGANPAATLNKILPSDIRIVGWTTTEGGSKRDPNMEGLEFDARFDCFGRTYKYLFYGDEMDVDKMREAAGHLIGSHDFRNLCKIDVTSTKTWVREIRKIDISVVSDDNWSPSSAFHQVGERDAVFCITIEGNAFLYHMIRCIVSVLFMVGRGKEQPSVVLELLDINKNPRKPNYVFADHFPLILQNCDFRGLEFRQCDVVNDHLCSELYRNWRKLNMELQMHRMLLEQQMKSSTQLRALYQDKFVPQNDKHIPLLERKTSETLEQIIANYEHRKRKKESS